MEFYEPRGVRLNAMRRIDPDSRYEDEPSGPELDRYGFVGNHKQASETTLPVEVLRERELKWIEMLKHWDKWVSKKFKKVKERCRKGIPPSVRGQAWQQLSGSNEKAKENQGVFDRLDAASSPEWENDIKKDLCRTFPYHGMFSDNQGQGQSDLFRMLKAYSIYNPKTGYCQAMAPVAAVLLMHMTLEDAFWCFVMICEKYIPEYYEPKLEAVKLDAAIFGGLLEKCIPQVAKHMKTHRIDPLMYMTEWFMCILARNIPFSSVLRVWDMFFCEGVKVIFRTSVAMVKILLPPEQLPQCPGLFETNERLRHLENMQEDVLIPVSLSLKISEKLLRKEHEYHLSAQSKPR
ncbi:TBC1 domain family member 10A-like [Actinia tenebrosa]|uniref:TBC1 domain family member 10A-like n=1 Tax=Actinia tenebrosa TaxID=6105 RepID=A0A6P8JAP1_ACTTE|nr:TBC1 domain family member 10A-like [Actinia tenebrosa]